MPRRNFSTADFSRTKKRTSDKLIFISCEGVETEEVYFDILASLFHNIRSKIKIVSVRGDYLLLDQKTQEEKQKQNMSSPKYVFQRMQTYLAENQEYYQLRENSEDEYWLVMDIDDHTSAAKIDEWNHVLKQCDSRGYSYAISNPNFEFWLYLHHCILTEEDHMHCVNEIHPYCKDPYFLDHMKKVGVFLHGKSHKKPLESDYTLEKVIHAMKQAKSLEQAEDSYPKCNLGSTVYQLIEKFWEWESEKK